MGLSKKTALIIFTLLFPAFFITFVIVLKLDTFGLQSREQVFFQELIFLSLTISLIISVCLWWVFRASIIHPIEKFTRIAKIINSGNLGTRIIHSSNDELGELAININAIINNLTRNVQSMANSLRDEKEKEGELAVNLAKLQQAQAKDEALLGNLGEGVVAIDQAGKIFLFNKAAAVLTGFTDSEALGKSYTEILNFGYEKETDRGRVPDFIYAVLNRMVLEEFPRIQIITKYSQKIPVTQSATLITDRTGRNYGVIVVLRNITRERQLDKLKDEFVSIASHELRTPMTAIKGLISMIFEGDYGTIDPQMKEPLSDIAQSTQRLIELVNDMLDVSRLEGGRIKYSLSNFKIADLIKETLGLMHPVALQKGIELTFNQGNGGEIVQADPNKLKQILSNLIGNSIKFTDSGFIEIRYVIHADQVIVSVRDTGIGITPEDQTKLFSKFQQVSSSQLGRPVGTGLGLYISREFAKKMGGDLWIANSLPRVGSVFSLSVPLAGTELAKEAEYNTMQSA